jgi:membrane-associated phospholipid phosphatase
LKHKFWSKVARSPELLTHWGLGWLLALASTWIFIELAWDVPIMLAIHRYTRPWLTLLMLIITQTGNWIAVIVLAIALYWLWRHARKLDALTMLVSFIGAVAISSVLKLVFARPRPDVFPPLVPVSTYSFPSGHALAAMGLYGLLAILLWRGRRRGWAVLSAAWVLLIGLSRIYLGVHYPSDVLASLALGTLWLVVILNGHDRLAKRLSGEAEDSE